ncbi:hypothetical protein K523DRAFT_355337 [Schizophyllum commune Tattone D]|nr:hypothetical protein K523DRAFT_355337 [Schizophyllum commune Tattone D]
MCALSKLLIPAKLGFRILSRLLTKEKESFRRPKYCALLHAPSPASWASE